MSKPRLLDLFCGAGGCARGYVNAGFDVTGVDLHPQPRYLLSGATAFVQADALAYVRAHYEDFDVIHASPPCQAFTAMKTMPNARPHLDLLTPTRDFLQSRPKHYVIENVPGAPIEMGQRGLFSPSWGFTLCGSMFGLHTDGHELRRHRLFESSFSVTAPPCRHGKRTVIGFYGYNASIRKRPKGTARGTHIVGTDNKLALVRDLMGIDWMTWGESNQAVPPAYTQWIGERLLRAFDE